MSAIRIQTGAKEPIQILIVDVLQNPLSGLSNIKLKIRRVSDDFLYDWSDDTFKAGASVVAPLQVLVPVSATYSPGEYKLNTVSHVDGWNTSLIVNPVTDDTYRIIVVQDGTPENAANVPQIGEIKVGDYVDNIDAPISGVATPADVDASLVNIGLDHLVQIDAGGVAANPGTYIRQIIDALGTIATASTSYQVYQNYSLDFVNDILTGHVWVENNNLIVPTPTTATITWYDEDGTAAFSVTDPTPDAQGVFKITKPAPGLVGNSAYYAIATVDIPLIGVVASAKGAFTVG